MKSSDLRFALDLASMAERELLSRFPPSAIETKPDGSFVTDADRQAEAVMRACIRRSYPEHGILGEEGGAEGIGRKLQWLLDPLDGTASFVLGLPKFGTLIALVEDLQPRLGVVHLPVTRETLFAQRGAGCWYRRGEGEARRVHVDDRTVSLDQSAMSFAGVDGSDLRPTGGRSYQIGELLRRAARIEFIGDCVQHMLVATGHIHAAFDPITEPWDAAALIPCIEEAGGIAGTADGETQNVTFSGSLLTCANRSLYRAIVAILNRGEQ